MKRKRATRWETVCQDIAGGGTPDPAALAVIRDRARRFGIEVESPEALCRELYRVRSRRGSVDVGTRTGPTETRIEDLPPELLAQVLEYTGPSLGARQTSVAFNRAFEAARLARCSSLTNRFARCADGTRFEGPVDCGALCVERCDRWILQGLLPVRQMWYVNTRDPIFREAWAGPSQRWGDRVVGDIRLETFAWIGRASGIVGVEFSGPFLLFETVDGTAVSAENLDAHLGVLLDAETSAWYGQKRPVPDEDPSVILSSFRPPLAATAENACDFVRSLPVGEFQGFHRSFVAWLRTPRLSLLSAGDLVALLATLSGDLPPLRVPLQYSLASGEHRLAVGCLRLSGNASVVVEHSVLLDLPEQRAQAFVQMRAFTLNRGAGLWRVAWYRDASASGPYVDLTIPPIGGDLATIVRDFSERLPIIRGTVFDSFSGAHVVVSGNGMFWCPNGDD